MPTPEGMAPEGMARDWVAPEPLGGLCLAVFGDRLSLVEEYVGLLAREGVEWGLIGPREVDRLWERHIVNSLCVLPLVEEVIGRVSRGGVAGGGVVVADMGSGAGLPGIVLALARPGLRVDLVEPKERRVRFLEMCVERLGLRGSVSVVRSQAVEYCHFVRKAGSAPPGAGRAAERVVVCRALAGVGELVEMVHELVPPAELLAIKGDRAAEEVEAARGVLESRGLGAEIVRPDVWGAEVGTVVRVRRR